MPSPITPRRFDPTQEHSDGALEQGLLAALARAPDQLALLKVQITPDMFFHHPTEADEVFTAIEKRRQPVVPGTWTPCPDLGLAAGTIHALYLRRQLVDMATGIATGITTQAPAEILDQVQAAMKDLVPLAFGAPADISVPALQVFCNVLQQQRAQREFMESNGLASPGLPTGFSGLDKLLGGLQPGIHLLAAEPGAGKTTFAMQISTNVATRGFPVVFVSFEESLHRLGTKAMCQVAGLTLRSLTHSEMNDDKIRSAVVTASRALKTMHFVEGHKNVTVSQVERRARDLMEVHQRPICLVVVDYLQRWAACLKDTRDYRLVVSSMVNELRSMALSLNSPVLAICSQNRPGQGQNKLTSLKESGDLEYSADSAWFLVKLDNKDVGEDEIALDLHVEKNRYGGTGKVSLAFARHQATITQELM